jgi:hypothetical protein
MKQLLLYDKKFQGWICFEQNEVLMTFERKKTTFRDQYFVQH